ncbi:hypothetical protein G6O69_14820 [Pseudenhygromyxa sp. WMMC2535]|uniref:carboxypeptidase-like regulatory domain-containing protein n=1 Tax=Pseudenhygromyxa sp. WMMC2535 TaxID=2712867 RepID=UPI001555718F|nr:carboxypeptidase-like regulatory domain-containing protein [Pseudenhygromyxa sp. WMMC2535]NVB39114.1 hypothetical protein [Pseudenhygromyxa sp. WMMC2535]
MSNRAKSILIVLALIVTAGALWSLSGQRGGEAGTALASADAHAGSGADTGGRGQGFEPPPRPSAGADTGRRALRLCGVVLGYQAPEAPGAAPGMITVSVARPGTAHPVRSARLSAEGRWQLDLVPGAPLQLAASVPGFVATSQHIADPQPCAKKVYELTLSDEAGTRLHGTVSDVFGGAISGAEVDVIPRGHQNGFGFEQPIYRALSDDEGAFELLVPSNRYVVRSHFPGYASASASADTQLREQASVSLVLSPAASISGRVVDAQGAGIPDAELRMVPLAGGSSFVNYAARADAVSGPEGVFRIDDVAFGSWAIYARSGEAVSSAPAEVAIELYDQVEDVVVSLDRGTPVYGAVHLRGEDTPISDALVTLKGDSATMTCTPSDDSGVFDCGAVPQGTYNAIVAHEQYAGNLLGASVSVSAEQRYIELEVEPGYTLSGRVSPASEGVAVRVRMDADTLSMGGMGYSMMNAFRSASTDREGRFSIGPLALGSVTLIAEHQAFGRAEVQVDRALAESGAELELALAPAASLSGRVGGLGQTDATTLELVLSPLGEPQRIDGTRSTGAAMYTLPVDASGAFAATGLEPGRYGLSLRHTLGAVDYSGPETLELDDGQRASLELVLSAQQQRFAGAVVDAEGSPVEGAVVYASKDPSNRAVSDVDGQFSLVAWSDAESLRAGFHRAGYSTAASSTTLQAGGGNRLEVPPELDLVVEHGDAKTGRLVITGKTRVVRPLSRSGTTTVSGLLEGEYQVHVCADERYGAAKVRLIGGPASVPVTTHAWRSASGQALAPDGQPLAASQVFAMPTRDPCGVFSRAARASFTGEPLRTDAEGRFEISGLPPGPTALYFIDSGGEEPRELTITVDIEDGEGTHDLGEVQL